MIVQASAQSLGSRLRAEPARQQLGELQALAHLQHQTRGIGPGKSGALVLRVEQRDHPDSDAQILLRPGLELAGPVVGREDLHHQSRRSQLRGLARVVSSPGLCYHDRVGQNEVKTGPTPTGSDRAVLAKSPARTVLETGRVRPGRLNLPDDDAGVSQRAALLSARDRLDKSLNLSEGVPDPRLAQLEGLLKNEPDGLAALHRLQSRGLLSSQDSQGKSLLDNVYQMSRQELIPELKNRRAELVSQSLQDVDNPNEIFQGHRETCGATSASIVVAQDRPGEYMRLLKDLSGPGKSVLADGKGVIETKPDAFDERVRANPLHLGGLGPAAGSNPTIGSESKRTVTGLLLQPALMEFADGSADYDNQTQRHTRSNWATRGIGGLLPDEQQRLAEALLGRKFETLGGLGVDALIPGHRPDYGETAEALKRFQTKDFPAFANLDVDQGSGSHMPAEGSHWVAIRDVRQDENGQYRVYFEDPNRLTLKPGKDGKPELRIPDPEDKNPRYRPSGYQVDENGQASMPLDQFYQAMWALVTPKRTGAGGTW